MGDSVLGRGEKRSLTRKGPMLTQLIFTIIIPRSCRLSWPRALLLRYAAASCISCRTCRMTSSDATTATATCSLIQTDAHYESVEGRI